jgi:hypothetical protein
MKQIADALTWDMLRAGETEAERAERLAHAEAAFNEKREKWLASLPSAYATRIREANPSDRTEMVRESSEIVGALARDDAEAASDVLDPFIKVLPDGSFEPIEQLPDGRRLADLESDYDNLCLSVELMRSVGRALDGDLARRPFMRFLIQAGVLHIADAALAAQLGVAVSPPLRD